MREAREEREERERLERALVERVLSRGAKREASACTEALEKRAEAVERAEGAS